ncbi:Elongation factor Tu C-terminal domain containing protein [Trichomonas vaginalis G3]|uniref:Elongation factor Tu C-terminal domain containing protein n=1 Tax=Trichomonas vaginalis (strain ATCC PRA-98 / G3) TaxID=412133 RepID=A2FN77_TRIV3|nr:GTPase protein [Trichomonas vaginalis G3]EAX93636.1 Elongation factor Tu C-terminal domain containing protein [Trichomonas vaginalis G3]KAI5507096.1 GTPase protein [Trichomonas vaginalis G3]|eukprot:XP_001306566.1 Elongation factor Tu C-terminal domain containing protein [Trichomonas vaginalis G3]
MSKKASRKLLYDADDFDDDEDEVPRPKRGLPARSQTVADLKSASSMYNYQNNNDDYSDVYDEPYGYDGEEDFNDYDDDSAKIDELIAKLKKTYDISKCDMDEIFLAFRNLDYDYSVVSRNLEKGDYGKAIKKKSQKHIQIPASQTPSKLIPPKGIASTFSCASIKDIEQHLTTKVTKDQVYKQISTGKKHVNLVIVGHVDAGKSTLIGHVLLLSNFVEKQRMDKIMEDSKATGHGQDYLAWIMAEDESERSHGVTIDVALNNFETEDRKITVLDAPGHRDFVPNMIAGASQADSAILVVDVSNPNIERGQAGEHILLCRSLGVKHLIVAINKMDSLEYMQSAYEDVCNTLTEHLKRISWSAVHFIPTVATDKSVLLNPKEKMPWYKGPTILQAINQIPPYEYDINDSFLMCISEAVETSRNSITVSGRVESGYVAIGDNVKVLPGEQIVRVCDVQLNGEPVDFAAAGYIADITLTTSMNVEQFAIGSAIFDPKKKLQLSNRFTAHLRTFDIKKPILQGTPLVFHRHAVDLPLKIESFTAQLDPKTKKTIKKGIKFCLARQFIEATFSIESPIPIDTAESSRSFGTFIVRTGGETVGFGGIISVLQAK